MLANVTLADSAGALAGVVVFAAVLFAPGYLVAYAANLFGFRRQSLPERSLWAIALSFGVSPIAAHLLGRLAGMAGLGWLFAVAAVAAAALLLRDRPAWLARDRGLAVLLALGWTAAVLLLTVDLQLGHRLFFSVVLADGSYRVAFTEAVLRTGLPPANPLYFAGAPGAMRYFYFWYVLCAAVARLAQISAAQAFAASCVWAGFGLLATVHLYTSHFFHWPRRQRWLALGLLLVTGADLLPALGQSLLQPALNGDTEWWSVDPLDSWPDSLLWVPHHVAAVLCCLLVFLLLWRAAAAALPVRDRRWALGLAAVAAASAFGLSVYVAFGFALLMVAWLLRLGLRGDAARRAWWRHATLTGAGAAVLLLPFLRELLAPSTGEHAPRQHLFVLSVRQMIDSGLLSGLPVFGAARRAHPVLLDQGLRLLLLPAGLALELGLYGAVLVLLLIARRKGRLPPQPAREASLFFALTGLALTMFVSSAVITNNDFGYRAVMLPQFFLLLLAADLLGSPRNALLSRNARAFLRSLMVLGAAGLAGWAILLRAWLPYEVAHPANGFSQLPGDAYQIRQAFHRLHQLAAPGAVVAFRPIDTPARKQQVMDPNEFYQRLLVQNAGRQFLNAEGKCATHFGGDPAPCPEIQRATARLYATPIPAAGAAQEFCRRFGVQFLLLSAWDPLWRTSRDAPGGWPAALPAVADEPRFRILDCR